MIYFQIMIRGALLFISLYGYMCRISKHIKVELVPGLLFSGIGGLMFAAGILNLLQETAWIVWAGGVYFFIRSVKEKQKVKEILTPGIVFFFGFAAFFLLLLYQSKFMHYDDYSHWGVAAKVVCQRDYFPSADNRNIGYQSYPLGSTSFVYYISEIMGIHPEWLLLCAQAILMVGMAVSLFAFCKRTTQIVLAGTGVIFLLCCNVSFVCMLVDTLLPLTGFAAFAFCIYYRDDIVRKMYFVIPYVVFLVSIKNSGVLFAVFVMLTLFLFMEKKKENYIVWLKVLLCPVLILFFWKKHVKQCFVDGSITAHSMSFDRFNWILSEKTGEDINIIIRLFWETVLQSSSQILLLIVCCCAVWLIANWLDKKQGRTVGFLMIALCVSYLVYQVGTLAMYLVSMPKTEAFIMAGYDRYYKTILIYITAILLMGTIMAMTDSRAVRNRIAGGILTIAVIFVSWNVLDPNLDYYQKQDLEGSERQKFDMLIDDYKIESGLSYMIIVNEERDDKGYLWNMAQYLLDPERTTVCKDSKLETMDLEDYDYIIMFEESETAAAFMNDRFAADEPVVRQELSE